MSKHKDAIALIKALTGQANVLTIPRVFVDYTGSLDCALFLSQVIYWSDKGDSEGWFYKSYGEWEQELCLTEYQVRKAAKHLAAMGILETKLKKANGSPTLHYRLDFERFSESILKKLKNPILSNSRIQPLKSGQSITETTAEITKETTSENIYIGDSENPLSSEDEQPKPLTEKEWQAKALAPKVLTPKPDPLQEHPAVIGAQARVDIRLTKRQLELIADRVPGAQVETFLMIMDKWIGKGYRQNDIEGVLQWFDAFTKQGLKPWEWNGKANGNGNHNGRGKPQQSNQIPVGRGWSGKGKEAR